MSRFRKLLRSIVVGVVSAIGGILGNLAATVILETFFEITVQTIIATVVGMFLAVLLLAAIENWPDRDAEKLLKSLEQQRSNIRELQELHQGGQIWTDYHAFNWRNHQAEIASIKQKLNNKGIPVAYSRWDDYPPPRVGRFVRLIEAIKQGILFFVTFGLAFVFVLSINNVIHQTYLNIIRQFTPPQPIPTVQPEVTLTPAFAALPSPTNTVETLILPESTPDLLTPSATPTVPTPTVLDVFENTPTALPELMVLGTANANLRSGPGTIYEKVGILGTEEIAQVLAINNDGSWYLVQLEDGTRGWISANVVESINSVPLTSIPVAATIPPTPSPTSTPTVVASPEITIVEIIPLDTLRVTWEWNDILGENDFYAVRLWPADDPTLKHAIVWLKETEYLLKLDNTQFPTGEYFLNVAVINSPLSAQGDQSFTVIVESPVVQVYIPPIVVEPTPVPTPACPPVCP